MAVIFSASVRFQLDLNRSRLLEHNEIMDGKNVQQPAHASNQPQPGVSRHKIKNTERELLAKRANPISVSHTMKISLIKIKSVRKY